MSKHTIRLCCSFSPVIFFSFIFISWRLITLQSCSRFCHTLTWISHGVTCIPHPDPSSHLPLHPIPLGLPSAPGPSTCLMHPAWAGGSTVSGSALGTAGIVMNRHKFLQFWWGKSLGSDKWSAHAKQGTRIRSVRIWWRYGGGGVRF